MGLPTFPGNGFAGTAQSIGIAVGKVVVGILGDGFGEVTISGAVRYRRNIANSIGGSSKPADGGGFICNIHATTAQSAVLDGTEKIIVSTFGKYGTIVAEGLQGFP